MLARAGPMALVRAVLAVSGSAWGHPAVRARTAVAAAASGHPAARARAVELESRLAAAERAASGPASRR